MEAIILAITAVIFGPIVIWTVGQQTGIFSFIGSVFSLLCAVILGSLVTWGMIAAHFAATANIYKTPLAPRDYNPLLMEACAAGVIFGVPSLILLAIFGGFYAKEVLPFVAIGYGVWWYCHPERKRRRFTIEAHIKVDNIYNEAKAVAGALATPSEFREKMRALYVAHVERTNIGMPPDFVVEALLDVSERLYTDGVWTKKEGLTKPPEPRSLHFGYEGKSELSPGIVLWQKSVAELTTAASALPLLTDKTLELLDEFTRWVMPVYGPEPRPQLSLEVPLCNILPDLRSAMWRTIDVLFTGGESTKSIFGNFREAYGSNKNQISQTLLTATDFKNGKRLDENSVQLPATEIVSSFLRGTALENLFMLPAPFTIPEALRFEHQWIVAPSGAGKTTALQTLIADDLQKVIRGEASLFVMDSQGTAKGRLVESITSLKLFGPGGALEGRLAYLQPDPEYPLALNIFDIGMDRLKKLTPRQRSTQLNSAIELTEFVVTALLGADLTAKQRGVFRYLIQALIAIPNATIRTMMELMEKQGYEKYRPYILKLDEYSRDFFEKRFCTPAFASTKGEIFWRLDTMMSNLDFQNMFRHPRNKLDLVEELQSAKVVVVHTDLELLGKDGTETFGRFMLAKLIQATQHRASIDPENLVPVFCYIDECQDYIANEPRIASLIDKARKQKVALTFAHQRLGNIQSADVLDALSNVAIRMASKNEKDAEALAKLLRVDPSAIATQPIGRFSVFARGFTPAGLNIQFPEYPLKPFGMMTAKQKERVLADMRKKYCVRAPGAEADGEDIIDTEFEEVVPKSRRLTHRKKTPETYDPFA